MCIIYIIIFAFILFVVYLKSTYAVCRSKKMLYGKTVLVTGGTAGMGVHIAVDIAKRGARVIIACPFKNEGAQALKYVIKNSGNKEVIFKLLDLSSMSSVRKFAEEILEKEDRLDILVNNAGVFMPREHLTEDNLSFTMQVNYFGPFLLTLLLLPLMEKAGNMIEAARIINVTSLARYFGEIDFENMNKIKHWTFFQIYANSKLCLLLFTQELSERLKMKKSNVVVNNADPGIVATLILKHENVILNAVIALVIMAFRIIVKTPRQGAQNTIYTALDDKAGKISGAMFYNCELSKASDKVYGEDLVKRVWEESEKLVGINTEHISMIQNNREKQNAVN